jgi:hypothetical protein
MSLQFFRRRGVLLKAEGTEGVDAVPVAATDGFRLFEGSSSTEFDAVERPADKPHFGNDEFVVSNRRATISGGFELTPPSAPGAAGATGNAFAERVLFPAAFAAVKDLPNKITRYNPISDAIPSLTGYWYHAGTLIKALGARVNITGVGIEIGQRFMGQCTITGEYREVTAAAVPSITLPTVVPVVSSKRNSELILNTLVRGGTASTVGVPLVDLHANGKYLRFDAGNAMGYREYTELGVSRVTDRRATFSMRLAQANITDDFNPWFIRDNGIWITAAYRMWESDTKVGLFSELSVMGQIEQISEVDIEGDKGWDITGRAIPSSAGNDELYIAFGDDTP